MVMAVARYVAGAAGARADVVQRLLHRRRHLRVLAHGEIVVRAPDRDRFRTIMAGKAARVRKRSPIAHDVDEDAIAALGVQPIEGLLEDAPIIQFKSSRAEARRVGKARVSYDKSRW